SLIVCGFHVVSERRPQVGPVVDRKAKTRRHHADDHICSVVELYGLSNEIRICAEAPLPKSLTQNDRQSRARFLFFGIEDAPDQWLHAKKSKDVARNQAAFQALRFTVIGEGEISRAICTHILE